MQLSRRLLPVAASVGSLVFIVKAKKTAWLPQQRRVVRPPLDHPGDPVDPAAQNLRYALAVAGIIEEFGTLKEGLAALGMTTLPELHEAVGHPDFSRLGVNDDGVLCYQPARSQPTIPTQRTTSPTHIESPIPVIDGDACDVLGMGAAALLSRYQQIHAPDEAAT